MKVSSPTTTKISNEAQKPAVKKSKKDSKEDLKAKIREKFGDKALRKKTPKKIEDKAELNSKKAGKDDDEVHVGDIGKNNPDSMVTQSKLKDVLKSGAFKLSLIHI